MATATVAPMATIATKGRATPVARARAQAGADLLADWPACRAVAWLANGAAGRRAGWPARWAADGTAASAPAGCRPAASAAELGLDDSLIAPDRFGRPLGDGLAVIEDEDVFAQSHHDLPVCSTTSIVRPCARSSR